MRRLSLFIVSFITWCFLTWPYDFVAKSMDWQLIAAGLFASLLVTLLFVEVIDIAPHKLVSPKRYLWFLYYLPIFFYYCIKANLDVLYRVIHPAMPIKPGIVKVKTKLKSPSGITALCNSITLTPGTLSVDLTDDGYIYVHWIYVSSDNLEKATEMIVEKFEKILERIFE
ncbi:Na+/H+ antiporter subunit E [Candidatus Omnitrophota bacterium]